MLEEGEGVGGEEKSRVGEVWSVGVGGNRAGGSGSGVRRNGLLKGNIRAASTARGVMRPNMVT